MRGRTVLAVAFLVLLAACGGRRTPETQMQIRQFQTREFENVDVRTTMKTMMDVLQDEGFIVKQGSLDLGLLSAEKQVDVQNNAEAFFAVFFAGANARYKKNSVVECSVNVSDFGSSARVRANFQMRLVNNKGELMEVQPIHDEAFYRDFFAKVDKAIFLAKERL
jgi:phosphatidate phosphatase APP1